MTIRTKTLAAAMLSLAALLPAGGASAADMAVKAVKAIPDLPFFLVVDDRLSYAHVFTSNDPGTGARRADGSIKSAFPKEVFSFSHFDIWKYGTNFFDVDLLKSTGVQLQGEDVTAGCGIIGPGRGCSGATEVYGLFRSTFGWNEIFNTKAFAIGPLKDISFLVGADANTKNNLNGVAKKLIVGGLSFDFALPYNGNFNISPQIHKEWSHSAFAVLVPPNNVGNFSNLSGDTDYKVTWRVGTSYSMDLGFLPTWLPLSISGNATWTGKKGPQNSPDPLQANPLAANYNPSTAVEFNSEPIRLTLDVGKMTMGAKYSHFVDVFVAYRYWQNKFGLDHKVSPTCTGGASGSCTEESMLTGLSVKF